MKKILLLFATAILFAPLSHAHDNYRHRGYGWEHDNHRHHHQPRRYYQAPPVVYYQQPPVRYYPQQPPVRYYQQPEIRYYPQPPQYPSNSFHLSW